MSNSSGVGWDETTTVKAGGGRGEGGAVRRVACSRSCDLLSLLQYTSLIGSTEP